MSDSVNTKSKPGGHTVLQLVQRLRSDDYAVRASASYELWQIAGHTWNLDEVGEKIVPDLLMVLHGEELSLQVSAVWALRRLAESRVLITPELREQSAKALIDLLTNKNNALRLSAVYALKALGEPCAVPALVEHCLKDEDKVIVVGAADALGHIKDPRAVPGLIKTLRDSKDALVRHGVILALGSLADARAMQPLADLLLSGDSLRGYAAISLGEIGDKRATMVLLEALHSDSSQEVRAQIVIGLGMMKDPRAVPELTRILGTIGPDAASTYTLRYNAVHALRMIGDESAIPALVEAIDNAPELQIRQAAIEALGCVANPDRAAMLLVERLHHKDGYVRGFAARALGFLAKGCDDLALRDYVVSHLIESLSDTEKGGVYEPRVCDEAAKSLHAIGTPQALAAIENWRSSNP